MNGWPLRRWLYFAVSLVALLLALILMALWLQQTRGIDRAQNDALVHSTVLFAESMARAGWVADDQVGRERLDQQLLTLRELHPLLADIRLLEAPADVAGPMLRQSFIFQNEQGQRRLRVLVPLANGRNGEARVLQADYCRRRGCDGVRALSVVPPVLAVAGLLLSLLVFRVLLLPLHRKTAGRGVFVESGLLAGAVVLIAMMAAWTVHQSDQRERLQLQAHAVDSMVTLLLAQLDSLQEREMGPLVTLLAGNPPVDADQFHQLVSLLARESILETLAWAPRVTRSSSTEGLQIENIWQLDNQGERQPVEGEGPYFPIAFVEPRAGGREEAIGFDLASETYRALSIMEAIELRDAVASWPVELAYRDAGGETIVVFQPVFQPGREATLLGLLVGVWPFEQRIAQMMAKARVPLEVQLEQLMDGESRTLFGSEKTGRSAVSVRQPVMAFGNLYMLRVSRPESAGWLGFAWSVWLVLALGLVVAWLVGSFVVAQHRQRNRLEDLVTEQTRSLRLREKRFLEMEAYTGSFIWETDSGGCYTFVSDSVFNVLGYHPDELTGKLRVHDLLPEAERERFAAAYDDLLAQPLPFRDLQNPVQHREGHIVWLSSAGHPLYDDNGYWIGFRGSDKDVSEVRPREERLKLFASVFQSSHEGIMVTDRRNRIIDVNPSFTRITGYARDEVIGKNPSLLSSGKQNEAFYKNLWQSLSSQGFWRGEVWNRRKDGAFYAEILSISVVRDDQGEVSHHVGVFTDISRIKEQQDELDRLANYDALTGIPNRRLLADRMTLACERAAINGSLVAVCFLDLDGFKPVNDEYGHEAGDFLLVAISRRLSSLLRVNDIVARLGGDEFVVAFTGMSDTAGIVDALERLMEEIAKPVSMSGQRELRVTASIGVTVYPDDPGDPDTLLRHADAAMYQAKQGGRGRYVLFDAGQERSLERRHAEYNRVEQALKNDELTLHYQPKVDMVSGDFIGVEALLRWDHPERGLLGPYHFLPAVEDSALETRIGEWVLARVRRDVVGWQQQGLVMPTGGVSVNIAAHQLLASGFAERLRQLWQPGADNPLSLLQVEILETSALEDLNRAEQVLRSCRAGGVRFALDDFGTGYSSLSLFRSLPVDWIKIDQRFVIDLLSSPADLEIVDSVVRLANAFRRHVIAEGVASLDHALELLRLGCQNMQGFAISHPLPASRIPGWVVRWQAEGVWRLLSQCTGDRPIELLVRAVLHRQALLHHLEDVLQVADLRPDTTLLDALRAALPDAMENGWHELVAGSALTGYLDEFDQLTGKLLAWIGSREIDGQQISEETLLRMRRLLDEIMAVLPAMAAGERFSIDWHR